MPHSHSLIVEGADAAALIEMIKADPRNGVCGPKQGDFVVTIDAIPDIDFGCCQVGPDTTMQVCEHYDDPAYIPVYQKLADYLRSIGVKNPVRVRND